MVPALSFDEKKGVWPLRRQPCQGSHWLLHLGILRHCHAEECLLPNRWQQPMAERLSSLAKNTDEASVMRRSSRGGKILIHHLDEAGDRRSGTSGSKFWKKFGG